MIILGQNKILPVSYIYQRFLITAGFIEKLLFCVENIW